MPSTRCCTPPSIKLTARLRPDGHVVKEYPPGRLGGECRPFPDRTTGETHWIDVVMIADGGQERPVPVETFIEAVHAAAFLGVKLSTLYAWAPHLESTDYRGSLLIFYVDDLVNVDMPQLANRLPRRRDVENERALRAAAGETLRPGRHAQGCPRDHDRGRCPSNRPRPREREKKR